MDKDVDAALNFAVVVLGGMILFIGALSIVSYISSKQNQENLMEQYKAVMNCRKPLKPENYNLCGKLPEFK